MPGVQIYCRRPSLGETKALIEMGTTHVAWDVRPQDREQMVLAAQIADLVREAGRISTLLIHSRKRKVLATIARMVRPDFLLLSSDRNDAEMSLLSEEIAPATRLMMSVPVRVNGSSAILPSLERAVEYARYAGALTVDTCVDPSAANVFGCTGRTNDWLICAEIVRSVSIPVVLAGGLTPSNVGQAIRTVRPEIVDACTSLELADKSKNLAVCREFVEAALKADATAVP